MSSPPEYLINLLDGASDASFVVQSNGVICHTNEPAQRMFNIVDGTGIAVTTYLSFRTSRCPGRETLRLTWQDVTSPGSFARNRKSADGIGMRANRERFPVTISLVKIPHGHPEATSSGEHTSSEVIDALDEDFLYCLYIHDLTPARLQLASLEDEVSQLSATKDAIIRASGQSLVVTDSSGCIKSVSSGLSEMFGYEQGDQVVGQNLSILLQEKGRHFVANDHALEEVQIKLKNGDEIDLGVGSSRILTSTPKFSGHTAIMIKNITQIKEKQREESLNDRISRGLRERSFILDAAFDPMFCTNKTGVIFMVNQAAVDQFGWSRGEFMGQNISMIVGGCHRGRHGSYMNRYMETGEKRMIGKQREIQARRKNGTEFVAELGLAEISQQGEDATFCGFIRNIAKQKIYERKISDQVKAQQEISEKLEQKQSVILGILDASFNSIFVMTEECIIQMVNKRSCDVFGWTKEEFIGNNISMIMTKDVAAGHDKYVSQYLKTGVKKMIGTQREVTGRRKDGSTFPCVLGLSECEDSGLICGFIRDLTTEKAAQAVLVEKETELVEKKKVQQKTSSELLKNQSVILGILDASFHALFVINEDCIIQMVNKKSCEDFGWTKEEFMGQNISMIMTSDVATNHDKFMKHYLQTGMKKMIGTQREVTGLRKDGSTFPCKLGLSETQESGLICGFIRDVTAEKKFENEILQKQKELLDNQNIILGILDASFHALFVINEQGIIQMANNKSCEVFGWTKEDFIGGNISMIMSAGVANHVEFITNHYLQSGAKKMIGTQSEVTCQRKDGSTFPCVLGLSETQDSGLICHVSAIN